MAGKIASWKPCNKRSVLAAAGPSGLSSEDVSLATTERPGVLTMRETTMKQEETERRRRERRPTRALVKYLTACLPVLMAIQPFHAKCLAAEQNDRVSLSGISLPATRIVSLAPNLTETLQVIGAADQVVGYSVFCKAQLKFPPRPVAGSFNQPNHDAIKALKPDVILLSEHAKPEDLDRFRAAGLKYLVLPASSIDDIVNNVRLLGTLTGKTAQAGEVADGIERIVTEARARSKDIDPAKRPRVFLEVDGPDPYYTAGAGSFISEMVYLAGGINVFADHRESYFIVAPEAIIKADPEYIFVGGFKKSADEVLKRPGWEQMRAVKSGKVRAGVWDLWLLLWRPGPTVGTTIQKLAKELGTARSEGQQ
jgi:iron complex transport system substrate-binding protein